MKPATAALRASWPLFLLATLLWAAYRGLGSLTFASEDYLIVGSLYSRSWLQVVIEELQAPWLGLSFVNFYRPVSTALLALELQLWGLDAGALHWTHLFVHGVNAVQVAAISQRLIGEKSPIPWATAGLFAISPLHPSAVAFIGSYATVFGCFFSLLALGGYLRFEETRERWAYGLALGAFAFALGSYEGAVVLPALLLLALLLPRPSPKGIRGRLLPWAPFAALTGVYFLLRWSVLGVFVGGYGAFQDRFLSQAAALGLDFLRSLPRLILPGFPAAGTGTVALILGLALSLGIGLFYLRRRSNPWAAVALVAWAWAGALQAPFSFVSVVPATGRFWYLPSFAATLALLAFGWGILKELAGARRVAFRGLATAGVLLLFVYHFGALQKNLEIALEADGEVRQILAALEKQPAGKALEPWFVAGVPDFARSEDGLPVAKIFQYGLSEASRPPFGKISGRVYPVPADAHPRMLPAVARFAGGRALNWDRQGRELEEISKEPLVEAAPLETLRLESVEAGAALEDRVVFRCSSCRRGRLFLLTPGAPYRSPWQEVAQGKGSVAFPRAFLRSMARHHRGDLFGWVEEQDEKGRLRAASPVFSLPLSRFRQRGTER